GKLDDKVTYQLKLNCGKPTPVDTTDLSLGPGGGKELLVQISGMQITYDVTKIVRASNGRSTATVIGKGCKMAAPNVGTVTDRIAYGLGPFTGFDSGDPTQFEKGLYSESFVKSFICDMGSEGRAFVGVMDDAYQLDEKGIFDILNINPGKKG